MKVYNGSTGIDSRGGEYKIYVAGVPKGANALDLELYFAAHGTVLQVSEVSKDAIRKKTMDATLGWYQEEMCGCCCLEVADRATYDRILQLSPHELNGRFLYCSPFLRGNTVKKLNKEQNKRRVLAKRVYFKVSDEELINYIEKAFGKVEHYFVLKPELKNMMNDSSKRKFRTFSILFVTEEAADSCVSSSPLNLPRQKMPIYMEKFSFKLKMTNRSTQPNEDPTNVKGIHNNYPANDYCFKKDSWNTVQMQNKNRTYQERQNVQRVHKLAKKAKFHEIPSDLVNTNYQCINNVFSSFQEDGHSLGNEPVEEQKSNTFDTAFSSGSSFSGSSTRYLLQRVKPTSHSYHKFFHTRDPLATINETSFESANFPFRFNLASPQTK